MRARTRLSNNDYCLLFVLYASIEAFPHAARLCSSHVPVSPSTCVRAASILISDILGSDSDADGPASVDVLLMLRTVQFLPSPSRGT